MKKLLPVLALALAFAACTKTESVSMRTAKITKGKWYQSEAIVSRVNQPDTDLIGLVFPSIRDNKYMFMPNGDFVTLEGPTKLFAQLPDSAATAKWEFKFADTKIRIYNDTSSAEFDITRFDDSSMVWRKSNTENGITSFSSVTYHRTN